MKLVVGCPVYDRSWILPYWFAHVEGACVDAGVEPHYLFVADPNDRSTYAIIEDTVRALGRKCSIIQTTDSGAKYFREWNTPRYLRMVELRNNLLEGVRYLGPDLFLSLDSDILLAKTAISSLFDAYNQGGFDAVGGKCFLTPIGTGTWAPSWANLSPEQTLLREDRQIVFRVDCIMAIKLMSPLAYRVDYELHPQGEDIGWSVAAARQGLVLGFDGRVGNKHVMDPRHLPHIDDRVGF